MAANAASGAFWFFLSLVPIVILLSTFLPYTSISQETLLDALRPLVPESMTELLATILQDVYSSSLAVMSVSLLATAWSSAKGFSALIRGLEDVYQQSHRAGYFLRRARGIVYTLILLGSLLLSILIMGLGRWFQHILESMWPPSRDIFALLLHLRFVPMVAFLTFAFAGIFKFGPGLKLSYFRQLPGSSVCRIELEHFLQRFLLAGISHWRLRYLRKPGYRGGGDAVAILLHLYFPAGRLSQPHPFSERLTPARRTRRRQKPKARGNGKPFPRAFYHSAPPGKRSSPGQAPFPAAAAPEIQPDTAHSAVRNPAG